MRGRISALRLNNIDSYIDPLFPGFFSVQIPCGILLCNQANITSMSDPFIGEIRIFAGNFAPNGWALCNGQLLQISQNTALYAVIGTTYGGDGKTNFALPNLQGQIPVQFGEGSGLSNRNLGASFGEETATLTANQMPAHSHSATIKGASTGTTNQPQDNLFGKIPRTNMYSAPDAALTNMAEGSISLQSAGGSLAHNNMQPYTTLNFIIAIHGLFPVRSYVPLGDWIILV